VLRNDEQSNGENYAPIVVARLTKSAETIPGVRDVEKNRFDPIFRQA
jgi:hypothetical protein